MHKLTLTVLLLFTTVYSQWVKWDGEWTTPIQRKNASIVYCTGNNHSKQGHTAVGLYWNESSFGENASHKKGEKSYRDFGLSPYAMEDLGYDQETIDSLKAGLISLKRQTIIALDYFNLRQRVYLRKGFNTKEAWFFAAVDYNGSKRYALLFNKRVKYLKRRKWRCK